MFLPAKVPNLTLDEIKAVIVKTHVAEPCQVVIVAMRGCFGEKNQRGIYDDGFAVVSPTTFSLFNGNTDPSLYRQGIASVKDGVVWFKKGLHGISHPDGGYMALRQARPIIVLRDDGKGQMIEDKPGWPWTDLHRGGVNTTSSLGCLTVPPSQWDAFRELVYSEMARYSQEEVPCILTEDLKT